MLVILQSFFLRDFSPLYIMALTGWLSIWPVAAQSGGQEPIRHTLEFDGVEREYFVRLPSGFSEEKTYWLLVGAHGGGGSGLSSNILTLGEWCEKLELDAIVVTPSFRTEERNKYRYPSLGEAAFLKAVISDLNRQYRLHPKILLGGYSAGGQFSHRFALQNPELVQACAPLSAGSWTTPDGRFFLRGVGEIQDPQKNLRKPPDAFEEGDNRRLHYQLDVTRVVAQKAKPGASRIPFLVMCGTLDHRLPIAKAFAKSLEDAGFHCETEWPRTDHQPDDATQQEFQKYYSKTVEFFLRHLDISGADPRPLR